MIDLRSEKKALNLPPTVRLLQAIFLRRKFAIPTKYAKHPVILRGRTSDISVFFEVFMLKVYKIPKEEVVTIIDVGANVGYTSIYFAHFFPNAQIIALEPEQSNYQMLAENTLSYRNISCVQAAIWSQEKELALQNPQAPHWGFNYQEATDTANGPMIKALTVPGLMEKFNLKRINLLKIDIEGGEKALFASGTDWLSCVDCLQIEIHSKEARKTVFNALANYPHSSAEAFDNHYILLHHHLYNSNQL